MKKILLALSIVLLSTVFALSSMHQNDHKNHGDVPFKKSMDKMHKNMMIKSSGNTHTSISIGTISPSLEMTTLMTTLPSRSTSWRSASVGATT